MLSLKRIISSIPKAKKTAVVLPVDTWEKLLSDWERLVEILEDQEDLDIVKK